MDEPGARQQTKFLSDLTAAMRATAEAARDGTLERCRSEAGEFIERLQSDDRGKRVRKEADADVTTIRDQARTLLETVRADTEQRITARRDALTEELAQLDARLQADLAAVESIVAQYEKTVAEFFDRMLADGDAANVARMAASMPDLPDFSQATSGAAAMTVGPDGAAPPDHWWLDAPTTLAGTER